MIRGFTRVGNNEIIILVNDAKKNGEMDPQDA